MAGNPYVDIPSAYPEPHWFWGGLFLTPKSPSQIKEEWLTNLEQWHNEHKEIIHMEEMRIEQEYKQREEMLLQQIEELQKDLDEMNVKIYQERNSSALLQQCAQLEGQMCATTKVEQAHIYELLMIVKHLIEQKRQ